MLHRRNFSLPWELCEVRHLVLVWERNLIVSRRIGSLIHNRLLLWPQTKLLPHHFSYPRAPINLWFNYWHLLRGNRVRCIGHHRKLLNYMTHRLSSRLHLLGLLSYPIRCLLSHRRLCSWWVSRLLTSNIHVRHIDITYLSSCLIVEYPVDSLLMRILGLEQDGKTLLWGHRRWCLWHPRCLHSRIVFILCIMCLICLKKDLIVNKRLFM